MAIVTPLLLTSSTRIGLPTSPCFLLTTRIPPRKKRHQKIHCTSSASFLDLRPESNPALLNIDLPCHDPSDRPLYDVIIIGAGPAGLRLADSVSSYGLQVCCIDPSPLTVSPNNYGVWVDEFESIGLKNCLDKTWPMSVVYIDDHKKKYLNRPYGRVDRKGLKTKLIEGCVSREVKFHKAKAKKIVHQEFKSRVMCNDGCDLIGSLVVDASGCANNFLEYDKPRNHAYQISHGILAEVEEHPFNLDKMVLVDLRDSHLGNQTILHGGNNNIPTFLYAMPFDSNLIFLEETSVISRPALSYMEVKRRMVARLGHLGIRVKRVIESEKCLVPIGGPLPRIPQTLMAFGAAASLVHPSCRYMMARVMALAPVLADKIAKCLGSTRMIRGNQLHHIVWNGLWTPEMRSCREFYNLGMEIQMQLDLKGTRSYLDAFFDLDPYYWQGFLSCSLSLRELASLGISMFGRLPISARFDILTRCPYPLVEMVRKFAP